MIYSFTQKKKKRSIRYKCKRLVIYPDKCRSNFVCFGGFTLFCFVDFENKKNFV